MPPHRQLPRLAPPSFRLVLLLALVLPFAFVSRADNAPSASAPAAAPRDDTLAYLEGLPDTNPYRATLLRLHTLPEADREALKAWSNSGSGQNEAAPSLTPEQQALAREFATELVTLSAQAQTRAEDWPVLRDPNDPDDPTRILMPGAALARQLAKLAVKAGDALPPDAAVGIYAAVAQLGRQQRGGAALIEQLVGVAIEGTAFSAAGRRLPEFSPAQLQQLSAAWSALHPRPDNARAFAGEFDLFFAPIVNHFLRPGLAALLAEDGEKSSGVLDTDPDAGFTRHLRLSGLADLGDGERRISLENTATGLTFTVVEGGNTEGIDLVSLDFEKHEAVIRRGLREAVIHLESKRIVERPGEHQAVARLHRLFAGFSETDQKALQDAIVERARRHPGGADGYADDLLAAYRRLIDATLVAAASPEARAPAPLDSEDPFIKLIFPALGNVGRNLNNSATSSTALQAAIQHRLVQLGAATSGAAPADPWAENAGPFAYEATPDGGFLLRSRYEAAPGKPLTYKFAAPDAGSVRAK